MLIDTFVKIYTYIYANLMTTILDPIAYLLDLHFQNTLFISLTSFTIFFITWFDDLTTSLNFSVFFFTYVHISDKLSIWPLYQTPHKPT